MHPQIRELGHGAYGTAVLMRHRASGELVAVKLIERGAAVRCNGGRAALLCSGHCCLVVVTVEVACVLCLNAWRCL